MSPRPAKSTGNNNRSPRIGRSVSAYFPVATLPNRITSDEAMAAIDWTECFNGPVKRGSFESTGTVANSQRSLAPINVSAAITLGWA